MVLVSESLLTTKTNGYSNSHFNPLHITINSVIRIHLQFLISVTIFWKARIACYCYTFS